MLPVEANVFVAGSKSSAVLSTLPVQQRFWSPPAISTFPFGNKVAAWRVRGTLMLLASSVNMPVLGS